MVLSASGSSAETSSLDAAEPQACRYRLKGRLSHTPFKLKAACCAVAMAPARAAATSALPGELQSTVITTEESIKQRRAS